LCGAVASPLPRTAAADRLQTLINVFKGCAVLRRPMGVRRFNPRQAPRAAPAFCQGVALVNDAERSGAGPGDSQFIRHPAGSRTSWRRATGLPWHRRSRLTNMPTPKGRFSVLTILQLQLRAALRRASGAPCSDGEAQIFGASNGIPTTSGITI